MPRKKRFMHDTIQTRLPCLCSFGIGTKAQNNFFDMKNLIKLSFLFGLIALFSACGNAPEGQKAEVGDAVETTETTADATVYVADLEKSVIRWTGSKPTGQHHGTLKLKSGTLSVANGKIVGGEFELDMNSIECTDLADNPDKKAKLEGHLKTGDFFEVEKYPVGKFVVTSVEPDSVANLMKVTGNLTLKDITKSVSFPANIQVSENVVTAVSSPFTIDRTQWGITFKSTTVGELADKAIHDNIGLVLQLVATRQPEQ
ncbi:MAG: YceI family protein [Bacteroidetes bacterium]|nr:MAG: YceI family protein [Bacteroidota bacterium]